MSTRRQLDNRVASDARNGKRETDKAHHRLRLFLGKRKSSSTVNVTSSLMRKRSNLVDLLANVLQVKDRRPGGNLLGYSAEGVLRRRHVKLGEATVGGHVLDQRRVRFPRTPARQDPDSAGRAMNSSTVARILLRGGSDECLDRGANECRVLRGECRLGGELGLAERRDIRRRWLGGAPGRRGRGPVDLGVHRGRFGRLRRVRRRRHPPTAPSQSVVAAVATSTEREMSAKFSSCTSMLADRETVRNGSAD